MYIEMFKTQEKLLRSHNHCVGVCEQIAVPMIRHYSASMKRCRLCDAYFVTGEIRCPCCSTQLRTTCRGKATFSKKMDRLYGD